MSSGVTRGKWITVAILIVVVTAIGLVFSSNVTKPRVLSAEQLRVNGLYLLEQPKSLGEFALTTATGTAFTASELRGHWTLLFMGFTHCPVFCPTTLATLNELVTGKLGETPYAADTRVVMVSLDPQRDSAEKLAGYLNGFNPDFTGVTGSFEQVFQFSQSLGFSFAKLPLANGDYTIDHAGMIALIDADGRYRGYFKPPHDAAQMLVTYRSARAGLLR